MKLSQRDSAFVRRDPSGSLSFAVSSGSDQPDLDPPPAYEEVDATRIPQQTSAESSFQADLLGSDAYEPQAAAETDLILPSLRIVIHIVGSRGDLAPFVPIARILRDAGHRVRIATHEKFRKNVLEEGLEFYPLGGDPEVLMAFMTKNGGLIPQINPSTPANVAANRRQLKEMINGAYESCVMPDQATFEPFCADLILANPPSFGSIHCAEALGVPFQVVFTMPWSPTGAFPHPFTGVVTGVVSRKSRNLISYDLVHHLTWLGAKDFVDELRSRLSLPPASATQTAKVLQSDLVPRTYCYSPALLPKPKDWGKHIDVVGFSFDYLSDQTTGYTPPAELHHFLDAGPPPIYCGFGSITGFDLDALYEKVVQAAAQANMRLVICLGWGRSKIRSSHNVCVIEACPHDWLFPRCAAVCHHGGAGTTATGLRYALPTVILSFFGDQPFWGQVVSNSGAGPSSVPAVRATVDYLTEAFASTTQPSVLQAARKLSQRINDEDGAINAVHSIISHIPVQAMRSDLLPAKLANRIHVPTGIKMSQEESHMLVQCGKVSQSDIQRYQSCLYNLEDEIDGDGTILRPIMKDLYTGIVGVVTEPVAAQQEGRDIGTGVARGLGGLVYYPLKGYVQSPLHINAGFAHLQRLYDPTFTPHGKVTDFNSGLKEGAIAFGKGWLGCITDVLVKPVQMGLQARKQGQDGKIGQAAAKGFAIGVANMPVKLFIGNLSVLVLPIQGLARQFSRANASQKLPSFDSALLLTDKANIASSHGLPALWDEAVAIAEMEKKAAAARQPGTSWKRFFR